MDKMKIQALADRLRTDAEALTEALKEVAIMEQIQEMQASKIQEIERRIAEYERHGKSDTYNC